jgi:hypothetical protein
MVDAATRRCPTGLPGLDAALAGGWPQGEVSELVGPPTSGRTTVIVATLAAATAAGGIAAIVDAFDEFDPRGAAEAGCRLERVLWVRGPSLAGETARPALVDRAVHQAVRACDLVVRAGGFSVVALDLASVPPRALRALPVTTWLRLARANDGRETVCLVAAPIPLGRSARGATVRVTARRRWSGTSAQSRRLHGLSVDAAVQAAHTFARGRDADGRRR